MTQQMIIIEKLKCDLHTLKYFINNSKIIKRAYNIIPILHEKHDFCLTLLNMDIFGHYMI